MAASGRRSIHLIIILIITILVELVLLGLSARIIAERPWDPDCGEFTGRLLRACEGGAYSTPSGGITFYLILPFAVIGLFVDTIAIILVGIKGRTSPLLGVLPFHAVQFVFFAIALILGLIPVDVVGGFFYSVFYKISSTSEYRYYYSDRYVLDPFDKLLLALFAFILVAEILNLYLMIGSCCCFGRRQRRRQRQVYGSTMSTGPVYAGAPSPMGAMGYQQQPQYPQPYPQQYQEPYQQHPQQHPQYAAPKHMSYDTNEVSSATLQSRDETQQPPLESVSHLASSNPRQNSDNLPEHYATYQNGDNLPEHHTAYQNGNNLPEHYSGSNLQQPQPTAGAYGTAVGQGNTSNPHPLYA